MIVGITINEHDIINFSIKDASGIHRYYEKEAVSNGEELIAIVDGKQIKLREAFHFEMVRKHSKLSKKADEQSKPIGKFKDNAALQKAYESLEKEFTRRSQRLRELQKERENMQAEIIRLNDIKFTQEHCDLYEENEWLKAELKRQLAEHEAFTKQTKAEIERLKDENCHDYHCMCLAQQENTELQKQVDELKFDKEILQKLIEKREKDTAKEILQEIWDETEPLNENHKWVRLRIKNIASRKGVEVE